MDISKIKHILYNKETGPRIRQLLETLCSTGLYSNKLALLELYTHIHDHISDQHWIEFINFLYDNIPDFLMHFYTYPEGAFSGLNVKTLVIPKHVSEIGRHCFRSCNYLENVSFEEGSILTDLTERVFESCPNLKVLDLSNTRITTLRNQGFYCYNGSTVILPDRVKIFRNAALMSFNKVVFPTVNSIQDLDLTVYDTILSGEDGCGFRSKVTIETKTDSDIITKAGYNDQIVLGPELAKNVRVWKW